MCRMLVDRGADLGAVDFSGDQPIDRDELGGEDLREVYAWMEKEMSERNIARKFGNLLLKPGDHEQLDRAQDYWDTLTNQTTMSRRKGEGAEERRARQAAAQQLLRLKREGVLPQDFDEIMVRYRRNSEEDRSWLERRFLLHLWDDGDAALRERRRVEATQERLGEEIEKLARVIENC